MVKAVLVQKVQLVLAVLVQLVQLVLLEVLVLALKSCKSNRTITLELPLSPYSLLAHLVTLVLVVVCNAKLVDTLLLGLFPPSIRRKQMIKVALLSTDGLEPAVLEQPQFLQCAAQNALRAAVAAVMVLMVLTALLPLLLELLLLHPLLRCNRLSVQLL